MCCSDLMGQIYVVFYLLLLIKCFYSSKLVDTLKSSFYGIAKVSTNHKLPVQYICVNLIVKDKLINTTVIKHIFPFISIQLTANTDTECVAYLITNSVSLFIIIWIYRKWNSKPNRIIIKECGKLKSYSLLADMFVIRNFQKSITNT